MQAYGLQTLAQSSIHLQSKKNAENLRPLDFKNMYMKNRNADNLFVQ